MTSTAPIITGYVAEGWEPVRDAFAYNLAETEEVGAGAAVYHQGRCVVNLVGGFDGPDRAAPYSDGTLQLVFSTTKGITAIAVALCVQRGLLDYDAPVARYWPEFAAAGKGAS
jgi:CubicO group peptidase (beta-lactamase class C family)